MEPWKPFLLASRNYSKLSQTAGPGFELQNPCLRKQVGRDHVHSQASLTTYLTLYYMYFYSTPHAFPVFHVVPIHNRLRCQETAMSKKLLGASKL